MKKNLLWMLLGVILGVGGFYFSTRTPESGLIKPTSSLNISQMFKAAVDANSVYSVQELMTPQTKNSFTANDLKAIRQFVGVGSKAEGGASYDNYEIVTFGTNKPVTLWLVPPFATTNHMWAIQKITEGATATSSS